MSNNITKKLAVIINNKWVWLGSAIFVLIGSYLWYLTLPTPDTIKVSINAPGITNLRSENPKPDNLLLTFSDSAAKLDNIGKTVPSGITISPKIPGEWIWISDSELKFTPSEYWAIATRYTVDFDESLFPSHVLLEDYTHRFETAGFSAELADVNFHQDPQDPKIKKLVATIRFTHKVDQDDFKRRVVLLLRDADKRIKSEPEDYPFTISFDETGSEAYIHSEAVRIPLKEQELILKISGKTRALRGGDTIEDELSSFVDVPGMYSYFRIQSAVPTLVRNSQNEPEQALIIGLTDGVTSETLHKNIEIYELPADKPAIHDRRAVRNNYWSNVEEISPGILALANRVEPEFLPTAQEYAREHSMKIHVTPERFLYIRIAKGVESVGGYILANTYDQIVRVPAYPREVEIMAKGGVLSLSGNKRLSVVSRGNTAVQFEVGKVLPNQIQHLISQTAGDYQNPYFQNYQFSQDNITILHTTVNKLLPLPPGKSQYTSFDLSAYLNSRSDIKNGMFFVKVQSWDPDRNQPTGVEDKRLILVTDLGLVVKKNADESRGVYVVGLASGKPVANAEVDVIGRNGLSIFNADTDITGFAQLPALKDFERDKHPTAILVNKQGDLSFIPFERQDRQLDLSRFDIGGIHQAGRKDVLSAYLFSDRGIYRPGDTFNIAMIVKSTDWGKDLTDIPLQVIITDSRGLTVRNKKFKLPASGFDEINYTTLESSPTGEYQIQLYLIKDNHARSLLGSTRVKVEEFLPDRMKINAAFSQERIMGWVHPADLSALISLKNLYGTPASHRRVTSEIRLSPTQPVFSRFHDFHFHDPLKTDKGFTERLPDAQTDDNGEATIPLNLERFDSASYQVSLRVNGFDAEGGRSVSAERNILVSPRAYLVGYKADGNLDYVSKDSERYIEFIAIDPELETVAVPDLSLELVELNYVSVLIKQDNGTYKYQSVMKETPVKTSALSLAKDGTRFRLPADKPGDYALVLRDDAKIELSKIKFNVAGQANLARSLEKNAELLIKLNKNDYHAGEPIEVHIKAPYTGAGLLTIERDKVYAHKWFITDSTSSVQTITLPDDIEGNAYINVSFVRNLESKEIFMSPLSYGVAPFTINRDSRDNKITLETPYLLRPGEDAHIKYKTTYPGKILVFAVDEGILQVANYNTPAPLSHFFKKRALEVSTLQILDLLLPEYDIVRKLAQEGGGEAADALSQNLNPFKRKRDKPVVFWSGILEATPDGGELTYRVPDYFNGSLRFMAVAVSAEALGATMRKSLVRGHFVISPNLPNFVAPGDEFTVSVNVANNVEASGQDAKVELQLATSEHVTVLDNKTASLAIPEGREKSVVYRIKANDSLLGSANFTFTAAISDKKSVSSSDISVRPAMPFITDIKGGHIKNDEAELKLERRMYPEHRTRQVSVSSVPLGISRGLIRYLEKYPYACTEQLVSQAVPYVALKGRAEFGFDAGRAENSIEKVIHILRARQNNEGAFGFWAANSHISPYQSVYALHFLHEARDNGYAIPEDMFERGKKYLRQLAEQDIDNMADARARAYAMYLLTLNGEVITRHLNAMREKMDKLYNDKWHSDISRAYLAASYKLLHLDKEAGKLISNFNLHKQVIPEYENFHDQLARNSQYLFILARHFPRLLKELTGNDILQVMNPVNHGAYNSFSSAFTIMALDAYADAAGQPTELNVKIKALLDDTARDISIPPGLMPEIEIDNEISNLKIISTNELPLFHQSTEAGFDIELPSDIVKRGIEIQREYRDADGKVIDRIAMGEEVTVHVKLRAIDDHHHYNTAIVDLLPGGFDIVLEASRRNQGSFHPDYVDLREDRVLIFGTVNKSVQEFVYKIKPGNKGVYVVPPVFAEGMYDRTVRATGMAGTITVE